ncbi:MAG TPA: hypothetical protein ENG40_04135 [Thermoprotei archaeon]|nr:hypothetical protein [Thermoprotei archaeon]
MLGKVYPLITPSQYKDSLPDIAGGVGTPRLIYNPELGEWLLFFTGWVNANRREIFVANIDRNLNIENIRKIVSAPPTRDAVNVMYDPWNNGYILSITEGGVLSIRYFDEDFREISGKTILKNMQDSGAALLSIMGSYSEENPNAIIFYPRRDTVYWRFIRRIDSIDEMSLDEPLVFSRIEKNNDVIDGFRVNNRIGILVEYFTDKQNWRSRIAMSGTYIDPNIRALSGYLPLAFNDQHSNFGHPSFTTGSDGKPKVLFSFFLSHAPPFLIEDYSRQWRHEIWVWEPQVDIFDPKTYGVMFDHALTKDEKNSGIYDLMGARKIVLQIKGEGKIVLEESVSVEEHLNKNFVKNKYFFDEPGRIVVEDPLGTVRIRSENAGIDVWIMAKY